MFLIRHSWAYSIQEQVTVPTKVSLIPQQSRINPPRAVQTLKNISVVSTKKIIFIDCGSPGDSIYGNSITLGIQILSQIAFEQGFSSLRFHMNRSPLEEIISSVNEGDIVALSATSPGHYNAIKLATCIKEKFGDKVLIIKGGLHEEFVGEELQRRKDYPVDISFVGEADVSFNEFLRLCNASKTQSPSDIERMLDVKSPISFHGKAASVLLPRLEPSQHVLPELRHLELTRPFTIFSGAKDDDLVLRVQDLRGCPETCTFCGLKDAATRISAKRFVEYIGKIVEAKLEQDGRRIEYVFFETGTFLMDPRFDKRFVAEVLPDEHYSSDVWIEEFVTLMRGLNEYLRTKYGFTLKFAAQTTIKSINPTTISRLKEAGLDALYIGVETLDKATIRRMLIGSKTGGFGKSASKCLEAVDILNRLGVNATCAAMVELGLEDKAYETVEELMKRKVHEIFIEYRAVYPGTPDANRVVRILKDGKVRELTSARIAQIYSKGFLHRDESPNTEDRSKLIVKDHDGKKLKIVNRNELREAATEFYTKLRIMADHHNYKVHNDGNYIKI